MGRVNSHSYTGEYGYAKVDILLYFFLLFNKSCLQTQVNLCILFWSEIVVVSTHISLYARGWSLRCLDTGTFLIDFNCHFRISPFNTYRITGLTIQVRNLSFTTQSSMNHRLKSMEKEFHVSVSFYFLGIFNHSMMKWKGTQGWWHLIHQHHVRLKYAVLSLAVQTESTDSISFHCGSYTV